MAAATRCLLAQMPVALRSASAIAFDRQGNLYIADARGQQVLEATLAGKLVVVAGTGIQGFSGDGGSATAAQLNEPQGLAVGADGTLYIADTGNSRIRALDTSGHVTTVAGTGRAGFGGDGGAAGEASLRAPTALAIDPQGRLLICDTGNHRIRLLTEGIITTIAGTGTQGFSGDGGPATAAALDSPMGLVVDPSGNVVVADTHNHRLRRISTSGIITTLAGTGTPGFTGDGGEAKLARLLQPAGLALASDGTLLVADSGNERLRAIDNNGVISTIAGSGVEGLSPDGALAQVMSLQQPRAVAISAFGLPVVANTTTSAIRELAGELAFAPAAFAPGRQSAVTASIPASLVYGQAVISAEITGVVGVPRGAVQVTEGFGAVTGSSLQGGAASLDLTSLSAGTHAVSLQYTGDGLNPSSASTVTALIQPAPAVALAAPQSMTYGAGMPVLSGALTGIAPHDRDKVAAEFSVSVGDMPQPGQYPIQATLSGAAAKNYQLSMATSSGQLTVTKTPVTLAFVSVPQIYLGVPGTLTASVASTTRGLPTGTVQFLDAGQVVASVSLREGVATAAYAGSVPGTHQFSLQYLGDGNFQPIIGPSSPVVVAALPDFALTTVSSSKAQVPAGGTATYTITVSAQPAPFTGAISLSLQGMPSGATAAFSPPQVIPGSGSATVTVTVQAPPALITSAHRSQTHTSSVRAAGAGLGALGVLALCGRWRRTSLSPWRLALLLAVPTVLLSGGCGARTVSEGAGGGVLSSTYPLQLTGTATNLAGHLVSHSVPITLTIQK